MRNIVAVILLAIAATTITAQTPAAISRQVEERTGHGIIPAPKAAGFALPDGVSLDDGMSEDEAVAIALWNNAALQVEMTALG
ncbi:MAG: hypothetical protein M3X11_11750, partial [Acidobacteriota bacterium]|nr:hypothetical protein [Acidobacteriota bacterium]